MATQGTQGWPERLWRIWEPLRSETRNGLRIFNDNQTQFGEDLVVERTPVIELNSSYGTSALRDQVNVTGSGSVTDGDGIITVSTGATASSTAQLESAEVGRYMPGYGAEVGVGIRLPTSATGNQEVRWGGIGVDGDNGFGFGQDANGLFTCVIKAGVTTKTYQQNWNIDKLDGTGNSGITLDPQDGTIYEIKFTWYGYGQILYGIIAIPPGDDKQRFIPCNQFRPSGSISTLSPNLRVCVYTDNGGDAKELSAEVGGRQYSIVGRYLPKYRFTGEWKGTTATSTTVIPLISFRRKTEFNDRSIKLQGFDTIVTTEPSIAEVRISGTLTGESWGTPTNHTASETALESDTSATAITGGVVVWSQLVEAGQNKNSATLSRESVDFDIPNGEIVTLCMRTITGTGAVIAALRMREEW